MTARLSSVPITRGVLRGGGGVIEALAGTLAPEMVRETAREAVERITADLRAFLGDGEGVVVNVASTEPPLDPVLIGWDLAMLEKALDDNDPRIPASTVYAYAAIDRARWRHRGAPHRTAAFHHL